MKIIHFASFQGNVGDIINHVGFYKGLYEHISKDILYERVEIRDFYRNTQIHQFDNKFADKINQYDLLVIGGGFFDVS